MAFKFITLTALYHHAFKNRTNLYPIGFKRITKTVMID